MKRKSLNIGDYQYVLDLFTPEEDSKMIFTKKKFIMLRNFSLVNNIVSDNNIFIIDIDTWRQMCEDLDNCKDDYFPISTHISFPILNKKINGFSNSPIEFNFNYNKSSLYDKNDDGEFIYGKDIYSLVDENGIEKEIICNTLRLYHPNNKLKLNGIICVDNYINNIHFYYLCKPLSNYDYNSETEFINNNHIYSEYIEMYFPNLNELYKLIDNKGEVDLYNVYFNENMNTIVSTKNEDFLARMIQSDEGIEKYTKLNNNSIEFSNQLVPLNLLLQPFQIVEDIDPYTQETYNVKIYLKNRISVENNYINNPFNITIYPYSSIDNEIKSYVLDEDLSIANASYSIDYKFFLVSKLGFDANTHKMSLISTFQYPNQSQYLKFNNNDTAKSLQEAYKYFYNINEYDYKYYWVNKLRIDFPNREYEMLEEFEKIWDNQEYHNGIETYNFKRQYVDDEGELIWETLDMLSNDERLRRMIEKNWDGIYDELRDWEVEEEFETGLDFIGFRIQIATDINYKNLIYNQTYTISLDQLDDFSFNIDNIFDKWIEIPEFVIGRTIFIDRIINRIMISNSVVLSKEIFKYIINEHNVFNINLLNYYNKFMKEIQFKNANANDMFEEYTESIGKMNRLFFDDLTAKIEDSTNPTEIIDDITNYQRALARVNEVFKDEYFSKYIPFNFVNNINCIINKPKNNLSDIKKDIQQKIIYKPIFFRTQDLQNIRLRNGVSQKIGINLANYMTKVDTFKLVIEDIEFVEISRNDIYVIFEINSNIFTTSSGKYNIITQDDEYISSGNWIVY